MSQQEGAPSQFPELLHIIPNSSVFRRILALRLDFVYTELGTPLFIVHISIGPCFCSYLNNAQHPQHHQQPSTPSTSPSLILQSLDSTSSNQIPTLLASDYPFYHETYRTMSIPLEQPTFGVEIDLYVAVLRTGQPDPHANIQGLPPVLYIPEQAESDDKAREYVFIKLKYLLDVSLWEISASKPASVVGQFQNGKYNQHRIWRTCAKDGYRLPASGGYQYIGIQLKSPVQYACPMAFDIIKYVISSITCQLRCTLDPSCGMRVHVGTGSERLSLDQVRRVASLSYAVEPFLFTLHDPLRRANIECAPICYFSRLAAGIYLKDTDMSHTIHSACNRYLGRDRRHGEFPMSSRTDDTSERTAKEFLETRKPGHYEPYNGLPGPKDGRLFLRDISLELDARMTTAQPLPPTTETAITRVGIVPMTEPRQRSIPRIPLPIEDPVLLYSLRKQLKAYHTAIPKAAIARLERRGDDFSTGIFEATRMIYDQPASCYIAKLCSGDNSAISFSSYYSCNACPNSRTKRTTIEFRLAEGSLDGVWIATWAKICTGLFHFALHASPSDFIDFLTKCDQGINDYGTFDDVVDLLDHVGLFAEAEIVERRLVDNMDRFGLSYDPQDIPFYD